jgi:hypothetical protein
MENDLHQARLLAQMLRRELLKHDPKEADTLCTYCDWVKADPLKEV